MHYLLYGYLEGKNPNYNFDNDWYIDFYEDVKKLNLNPLAHYLRTSTTDLRFPNQADHQKFLYLQEHNANVLLIKESPYFDENYYKMQCENLGIDVSNYPEHYYTQGYKLGLGFFPSL